MRCEFCHREIDSPKRSDTKYCSSTCTVNAYYQRKFGNGVTLQEACEVLNNLDFEITLHEEYVLNLIFNRIGRVELVNGKLQCVT